MIMMVDDDDDDGGGDGGDDDDDGDDCDGGDSMTLPIYTRVVMSLETVEQCNPKQPLI